jgi:hypothetical protein
MNVCDNNEIKNEINEEIILNNKTIYNYEFKINLKNKIEKIKKKSNLVKIFMIINEENKEYVENNNGIYIYIHDLKESTYKKLDTYINSIISQDC